MTPDCVDPLYANPVISSEQDLTTPVRHHRVSGHFEGPDIRFNIYLPPANQWKGRFFQYTYPTAFTPQEDTSVADDRAIGFSIASGGYAVQAGNASNSVGYRHTAAAAKFAETVAADYYHHGNRKIYGYLYGPSGGSFRTLVRPRTPPASRWPRPDRAGPSRSPRSRTWTEPAWSCGRNDRRNPSPPWWRIVR